MVLAALVLLAASSGGVYLDLINDSPDRVTSVEAAPAGTGRWQTLRFRAPLRGGGESVTVRLEREGCLYDLRFRFVRGPGLVHTSYDACNGRRYRIGTYRRAGMRGRPLISGGGTVGGRESRCSTEWRMFSRHGRAGR